MSIHKSLKTKKFKQIRKVRKRWERVKKLQRNKEWLEKNGSMFGLPKEKIEVIKLKIKEKIDEEEGNEELKDTGYENNTSKGE